MSLTDIISYLEEYGLGWKRVVVLGADADGLHKEIRRISKRIPVIFRDFRVCVPERPELLDLLGTSIRNAGIVHVAVRATMSPRFLDVLINVENDVEYPKDEIKGSIMLSTPAMHLASLGPQIREWATRVVYPNDHHSPWAPPFQQAIVFVHGMGEQQPMQSVQALANAVLRREDHTQKYISYPVDWSHDMRRLSANTTTTVNAGGTAEVTPRETDFYEYYWADKKEAKTRDLMEWTLKLLFRRPPLHLWPVWILAWLMLVAFFAASSMLTTGHFETLISHVPLVLVLLPSLLGLWLLQLFFIRYLGDAAQYFDPQPRNVSVREKIRSEGTKLLKRLIDSGGYDRIVVIGHSLGSVIAYDILQHLWATEYWQRYSPDDQYPQAALSAFEEAAENLALDTDQEKVLDYQTKQILLQRELRDLGNPWPITDLITLGSPLAHAAILFPNSRGSLEERKDSHELATNPPKPWEAGVGRIHWNLYAMENSDIKYKPKVPLSDGVFALTRWTNIYFPARFGLFGDIVGGPLRTWFGAGIRDLEASSRWFLKRNTLLGHTSYYWQPEQRALTGGKGSDALELLLEVLDLNGERLGIPREEKRPGL